jgi:hypothetical protein
MQYLININGKGEYNMSNENKGKQIVVVESGWVFLAEDVVDVEVGLYPTGCWKLLNASVIRSWGTTAGLGEIAIKGPTKETVLDYCGNPTVPKDKVLFHIPCTY